MKRVIPPTVMDVKNEVDFLAEILNAATSQDVEALLTKLKICDVADYQFNPEEPDSDWQEGLLHWVPVGRDRGNAGRVKLANRPINPAVERTINGMEALIELSRRLDL